MRHAFGTIAISVATIVVAGCRVPSEPRAAEVVALPAAVVAPSVATVAPVPAAPREPARRCTTLADGCTFDEMTRSFRPMPFVRLSQDEVRTISYWLEAGGGYGGVWDARCELAPLCGKLCRTELMSIGIEDLAKVARTKPTFDVRRRQLTRWAQGLEENGSADLALSERPALTLHAGPIALRPAAGSTRVEMFIELEGHECGAGVAGGAVAPAPPAASTKASSPRPKRPIACPFPPDATADLGVAAVEVAVDATGTITRIVLLHDPGSGLGRAAEACVAGGSFEPARDEKGQPVAGKLVLRVRFER